MKISWERELVRGTHGSLDGNLVQGFKIFNHHSIQRCVLNDPFLLYRDNYLGIFSNSVIIVCSQYADDFIYLGS